MKMVFFGAAGLALAVAIGGFQVYSRDKPRIKSSALVDAKAKLAAAQGRLSDAERLPLLPPIQDTFREVQLLLESCGLSVEPELSTTDSAIARYSGAAFSYKAKASGAPLRVMGCGYIAAQTFPMTVDGISIDPSSSTLLYSIIGAKGPEDEDPS